MNDAPPSVPEPIQSAIKELWHHAPRSQQAVAASPAFRLLERACRSFYEDFSASRLAAG